MSLRALAVRAVITVILCGTVSANSARAIELETALQGAVSLLPDRDAGLAANVGFGVFQRPEFLGGEDYKTSPLPLIDIEYLGRFFASTQRGVGVFLLRTRNFRIGPRLTYDEGRDSSDFNVTQNLEDIDPSPEFGIYMESYIGPVRVKGDIRKGFADGHDGVFARLDMAIAVRASKNDTLFIGGNISAGDKTYMQAYFGVPATRATRQTPAFTAQAGPRDLNAYASFVHTFNRNWYLTVDGGAGRLLGDADSSPVAGKLDQAITQFYLGSVIGYRF